MMKNFWEDVKGFGKIVYESILIGIFITIILIPLIIYFMRNG